VKKENINDLKRDIKELENLLNICNSKLEVLKTKLTTEYDCVYKDSCDMFFKHESKRFKITNSFNPVSSWVDSFKKSNKWNNTFKWVISNALKGVIYKLESYEKLGGLYNEN